MIWNPSQAHRMTVETHTQLAGHLEHRASPEAGAAVAAADRIARRHHARRERRFHV
jgi:hypothetical protein